MFKAYLTDLLRESSTWRGVAILLTLSGIAISPEQAEDIAMGGAALVGVLGAFFRDRVEPTVHKDESNLT
jgi:hypothetical protein